MKINTILDHRGSVVSQIQTDTTDPGRVHHILSQDLQPIFDEIDTLKHNLHDRPTDMRPVATIPAAVVQQMMNEGSWNDEAHLKKWLNDPDNKCFRIWPGRV